MKIQMLNEGGEVVETCEVAVSPEEDEEDEAFCEDGEHPAAAMVCQGPIYRWTTSDGMTFQACDHHLLVDEFARLIEG